MPIVNETMYAEAQGIVRFDELNVLILGSLDNGLTTFAVQVDTLREYIENTLGSNVRIKLHCTNSVTEERARELYITMHDMGEPTESNLHSIVEELDIDVVFDQNKHFSDGYARKNFYKFQVVKTLSGTCQLVRRLSSRPFYCLALL